LLKSGKAIDNASYFCNVLVSNALKLSKGSEPSVAKVEASYLLDWVLPEEE